VEVVQILVERGADLNGLDVNGRTPLDIAEENGQKQVAELLRHLKSAN